MVCLVPRYLSDFRAKVEKHVSNKILNVHNEFLENLENYSQESTDRERKRERERER